MPVARHRLMSSSFRLQYLFVLLLIPLLSIQSNAAGSNVTRPNILIVVVDDMGFADLGSFGGEIETPNLDALAYGGIRFTDFQVAPACSPTRSMLLTGVDNHIVGLGNLAEEVSPNQKGRPGYEGHLNERAVSVAGILRDGGYRTYLAGKWHLGDEAATGPQSQGFDRSFTMLSGGASHFRDMKPAYSPDPKGIAPYLEDGRMLDSLPEDFDYSSQYYVDKMIQYLKQDQKKPEPFFAMLAFTAPHWPLQAPDAEIAKYAQRYKDGYDQLFTQRRKKMIELELLSAAAEDPPRPPGAIPWASLDAETKQVQAKAMAIYAAMIDQVDFHTGRLVNYLKKTDQFDNTLIIFLSDNGPEGHDLDETWPADMFPKIRGIIDTRFDHSIGNMGRPNSYTLYGAGWARAGSPHLRLYKAFPAEGGTRVAAFAHFPGVIPGGKIFRETVSVKDITPTLLDYANLTHPQEKDSQGKFARIQGVSIRAALANPALGTGAGERVIGVELLGKYGLRHGPWKLLLIAPPHGTGRHELFNLDTDPGEKQNLAKTHPEVLHEMVGLWQQYQQDNGVILPDWVSGY